MSSKWKNRSGIARIHVLLLVLCILLAVLVMRPYYRERRYHAEKVACTTSLRVVNGALVLDMISRGQTVSLDEAAGQLVSTLPGRSGYCPSGGTVYFVRQKDGEWKAICGMHDDDYALRTRLNSNYVLRQLREQVKAEQRLGTPVPKKVTVDLNGKKLNCELVTREVNLRRGTATSRGYEDSGTVAFYGLEGNGSFRETGAKKGEVAYFCFADEDYQAGWKVLSGWSGSAFGYTY